MSVPLRAAEKPIHNAYPEMKNGSKTGNIVVVLKYRLDKPVVAANRLRVNPIAVGRTPGGRPFFIICSDDYDTLKEDQR